MENEVKSPKDIAIELKNDVANQIKPVQDAVDQLSVEMQRIAAGSTVEAKNSLVDVLEAKSELKTFRKGDAKVEVKAPIDMLRANSVGDSQTLIAAGSPVNNPNQLTHVRDFMRIGKLSKPTYKYDRETAVEGSASVVAEGAKKPKVSFKMTPVVANAAKIALYYKLSTETVQDAPAFTYSLQGRGIELILQEEDDQLLYGTGTGEEALGLFTAATEFNAGSLRVENAQVIDVLYAAITQVRKSMFRANAIFMNPTDIAKMNLTKDADGRYLLPNILSNSASSIAGVTIAGIDAVNEGEFLVGALDLAVETFSVEDLHVEVSGSNEDDFITNKVTVLIEERLLQAITRPAALVKGSFTTAQTALMAA